MGPGWAGGGVVVDQIHICELTVGRLDVSDLGRHVGHRAERLRIQPAPLHRACRVACGEQLDVATGPCQPPSQLIDHHLGPAVERRRYRHPWRCDQPDAETVFRHGRFLAR